MLENKLIIFILKNLNSKEALIVPLEKELLNRNIRIKVGNLPNKSLDKNIIEINDEYEKENFNLVFEIKKVAENIIRNIPGIKLKDIGKIIYITDTDDYYFKNKKKYLNTLFDKRNIQLIKGKSRQDIPLDIIFMSQNLEYVLTGELKEYSPEEKEKISTEFRKKCEEDFNKYKFFFTSSDIKKWETYSESYNSEIINEKVSNMNCLLDELLENKKR